MITAPHFQKINLKMRLKYEKDIQFLVNDHFSANDTISTTNQSLLSDSCINEGIIDDLYSLAICILHLCRPFKRNEMT